MFVNGRNKKNMQKPLNVQSHYDITKLESSVKFAKSATIQQFLPLKNR